MPRSLSSKAFSYFEFSAPLRSQRQNLDSYELINWLPEVDYIHQVDLTYRAKRHEELIDHFFAYKKVISSDNYRLKEMQDTLLEIKQSIESNSQPKINIFNSIKEVIENFEKDNSGLKLQIKQDFQRIIFEVSPKKGFKNICLGTLSFPETELGLEGLKKFKNYLEKGIECSLDEDEFSWKYLIKPPYPVVKGFYYKTKSIILPPTSSSQKVPICLKACKNTNILSCISFTYLKLIRKGSIETEMVIEGGHLSGIMRMLLYKSIENEGFYDLDINFELSRIEEVNPEYIKNTIKFIDSVNNKSFIKILPLDDEKLNFDTSGCVVNIPQSNLKSMDELKPLISIIDKLIYINTELKLTLKVPKNISLYHSIELDLILKAINNQSIDHYNEKYYQPYNIAGLIQIYELLERIESDYNPLNQCPTAMQSDSEFTVNFDNQVSFIINSHSYWYDFRFSHSCHEIKKMIDNDFIDSDIKFYFDIGYSIEYLSMKSFSS